MAMISSSHCSIPESWSPSRLRSELHSRLEFEKIQSGKITELETKLNIAVKALEVISVFRSVDKYGYPENMEAIAESTLDDLGVESLELESFKKRADVQELLNRLQNDEESNRISETLNRMHGEDQDNISNENPVDNLGR